MVAGLSLVNELWDIISKQLIDEQQLEIQSWHIYLVLCSVMNSLFDDAELKERLIDYLGNLPEGAEKEVFVQVAKEQTNIRTRKMYP